MSSGPRSIDFSILRRPTLPPDDWNPMGFQCFFLELTTLQSIGSSQTPLAVSGCRFLPNTPTKHEVFLRVSPPRTQSEATSALNAIAPIRRRCLIAEKSRSSRFTFSACLSRGKTRNDIANPAGPNGNRNENYERAICYR